MTKPRITQLAQPSSSDLAWLLQAASITPQKLADLADFCSDELHSSVVQVDDQVAVVTLDPPQTATLYDIVFPLRTLTIPSHPLHGHTEILFIAAEETLDISAPGSSILFAWSELNQNGVPAFKQGSSYALTLRYFGTKILVSAANLYTIAEQ